MEIKKGVGDVWDRRGGMDLFWSEFYELFWGGSLGRVSGVWEIWV